MASGQYTLKVVFGTNGEGFGKLQSPLVVDPYDSKKFSLSAVAMSREMHTVDALDNNLDAALLADKTPLIVQGMPRSVLFRDLRAFYVRGETS